MGGGSIFLGSDEVIVKAAELKDLERRAALAGLAAAPSAPTAAEIDAAAQDAAVKAVEPYVGYVNFLRRQLLSLGVQPVDPPMPFPPLGDASGGQQ